MQFLVGALKFLVRGDQLLIGDGQIIGRGLVLGQERFQVAPGRGDLHVEARVVPLGQSSRPQGCAWGGGHRFSQGGSVWRDHLEQGQEVTFSRLAQIRQRHHLQVDQAGKRVYLERQSFLTDRSPLSLGLLQRCLERANQSRARHPDDVELRLTRRRLEEGTGLATELDDLQPLVDDDARGGEPV